MEDVRVRPSHLALLPDSRFPLVNGRARRSGTDGLRAPDAVVSLHSGTPENEFCVDDDIPALITDRRTLHVPGRGVGRCGRDRDGIFWLRTDDTRLRVGT